MKISYEVPNPSEYNELRTAAGLSEKEVSSAKTALSRSIFSVLIRDEESKLIGMARIVGDGGCYFQIVDIAVRPPDKEIKKAIMNEITDYLRENAPKDADVILMADVPSIGLYQTFGFDYTYPKSISLSGTL
ncbi:GNAT family N-acetyltransferase [Bacillus swezeyi]|uniref:GNAT family N-acetyltransferase n=1 Tax=Bacillus swezeyi TaxID=1925020 RepID=UPI0027DB5F65|nr:GNAT family N-acetyltransferase [Bacillus swezeyi]MED1738539.1 GNAT family N-acetyltransferase [Bacillus swezeyi]